MERREIEDILQGIREARSVGQGVALATVVKVIGSAYRREGAKMLIREDGALTCMLSGGCLEPEVAQAAQSVIENDQPLRTSYNLDEETTWGLGIGCGGSVDIYVEKLSGDPLMERWLEVMHNAEAAVMATAMNGKGRMIVLESGEPMGGFGDEALEAKIVEQALAMLKDQHPRARSQPFGGQEIFLDVSVPAAELVIFGAGHDAIPMSRLGLELGFKLRVVDMRTAFAIPERFPGATVQVVWPDNFAKHVPIGPRSYVLVMNHHLEMDKSTLRFLLNTPAPYIGMLGPRSRYQKVLDALRGEGVQPTAEQLSRIRNPVGISMGAETPEEVALSTLCEILALRRGFGAGFLNGVTGRIHDPLEVKL